MVEVVAFYGDLSALSAEVDSRGHLLIQTSQAGESNIENEFRAAIAGYITVDREVSSRQPRQLRRRRTSEMTLY
jgi:hypothetical protein